MELLEKSGLEAREVCYAGDDWIDLPVLQRCGLAITVPAADHEVRDRVHWVTTREGGDGAVREICDLILTAQGHSEALLQDLLAR
jgi:3-deoxy-D-manno-octulosonate 8-phosphate phosphatase (KDO 8-P phosphatase)